MSYPRCGTCRHFIPHPHVEGVGDCESTKFDKGYTTPLENILPDGVAVEADEGWGFIVAAGFGCVHHEPRETECLPTDD